MRPAKVGVVVSDKMQRTAAVEVARLFKHPVYEKRVVKVKKFLADNLIGAKIGDKVKIIATRPLSKRKRWRISEILQKASE